jgi:hypothetical protein
VAMEASLAYMGFIRAPEILTSGLGGTQSRYRRMLG